MSITSHHFFFWVGAISPGAENKTETTLLWADIKLAHKGPEYFIFLQLKNDSFYNYKICSSYDAPPFRKPVDYVVYNVRFEPADELSYLGHDPSYFVKCLAEAYASGEALLGYGVREAW